MTVFFQGRSDLCVPVRNANLRPDPLNQNVKFNVIPRGSHCTGVSLYKKHCPVNSASPVQSPSLARFLALLPLAPALQPLHPRSVLFPECTSHAPSSGLCIRCSFCQKCASCGYLQGSLFRILLRCPPLRQAFANYLL